MSALDRVIVISFLFCPPASATKLEYYIVSVETAPYGYTACNEACAKAATGGKLISCISESQYDELLQRLDDRAVWIGYRQSPTGGEPDGGWVWDDCMNMTGMSPAPWAEGEPTNHGNQEDCAIIAMNHCGVNGELVDVTCDPVEEVETQHPRDCLCQTEGMAPADSEAKAMPEDWCVKRTIKHLILFAFLMVCCCIGICTCAALYFFCCRQKTVGDVEQNAGTIVGRIVEAPPSVVGETHVMGQPVVGQPTVVSEKHVVVVSEKHVVGQPVIGQPTVVQVMPEATTERTKDGDEHEQNCFLS